MRQVHVYGPQFPTWFQTKPESHRRSIGFSMEQIAEAKQWPSNLFKPCPNYQDLVLLPIRYDPGKDDDSYTLIGFRPLGLDNRFVIIMGCDQEWKRISPRCLDKADILREAYLKRSRL